MRKPNIIMIGVPNSGTSVLARMYQIIGWNFEPDHEVQRKVMHLGWLSRAAGRCAQCDESAVISAARDEISNGLAASHPPIIAKQHNLSWCLGKFADIFLAIDGMTRLVLVEKDHHLVQRSTQLRLKRDDPNEGWLNRSLQDWNKAAQHQYAAWPGTKHRLHYSDVKAMVCGRNPEGLLRILHVGQYRVDMAEASQALAIFDPTRDEENNPHRGLLGWRYPGCG